MISPRDEEGFGLIHVLVLLAVISVSVTLYFQARNQALKAEKSLDSSKSVLDANGALTAELTALVRAIQPTAPSCLDMATEANGRLLTKAFGTAKLTYTQDVLNNQWVASGFSTASVHESALLRIPAQRCRQPRFPQTANNPNANTFYFCLNISQDAGAPAGSFLKAPFAFAEVGWYLINLHTGAPLSCENFVSIGSAAGAQIFYTVYWGTQMGSENIFKKYTNTVTVGR
jgi:hypothetical protein